VAKRKRVGRAKELRKRRARAQPVTRAERAWIAVGKATRFVKKRYPRKTPLDIALFPFNIGGRYLLKKELMLLLEDQL